MLGSLMPLLHFALAELRQDGGKPVRGRRPRGAFRGL